MRNKNKSRLLKNLGYGIVVFMTVAGLGIVEKNTRTYRQFNETYQGYFTEEGRTLFIFDKEPKHGGHRKSEHLLTGNSDLTKKLEIGKKYKVKTMKHGFPILGRKRISSIEQ